MPSWNVHRAVAMNVFGISREIADKVNRIVDTEDVHDLGRRLPPKPRLIEWILNWEKAEEKKLRRTKALLKAKRIMNASRDYAYAFFLHHALDLLAPRLLAAKATKVPLEKCGKNILKAVCYDLEIFLQQIIGLDFQNFIQEFESKFNNIIHNPCLLKWIENTSLHIEEKRRTLTIRKYLNPYVQRALKRIISETTHGDEARSEGETIILKSRDYYEVIKLLSKIMKDIYKQEKTYIIKRNFGILMSKVARFSAWHSKLLDYVLLTPVPQTRISEMLFRITKRKSAGLGRYALNICKRFEDYNKRYEAIVKKVRNFEKTYLLHYGIELPQKCVEKYTEDFIEGYKIVSNAIPL